MGVFAAGQVALLPFPFSDLSRNKLRPAVLLAAASREDWIVCQITSNPFGDSRSLPVTTFQQEHCGTSAMSVQVKSSLPTNP
jgi:mRNA interferase MazF